MILEITKPEIASNEKKVNMSELIPAVNEMKEQGARFITITTKDMANDGIEMLYHFEVKDQVESFRLIAEKSKPIQSITGAYLAAFIAENELKDLFELDFDDLAVDFGFGNFDMPNEVPWSRRNKTQSQNSVCRTGIEHVASDLFLNKLFVRLI